MSFAFRPPTKRAKPLVAAAFGGLLSAIVVAGSVPAAETPATWTGRAEKFRLATGQDCLYQQDISSTVTVIHLFVQGGKAAVPEGKDGLAYLAARMALEIPDFKTAQDLMAQATRMRLSVLEDCAVISLECLSENLEEAVRVAAEIVQNPLITGLRIDNGKRSMSLYSKAEEDDAVEAGHAAAMKAFFKGQGYGSALYGTEASLKAIEKKDVAAYYAKSFTRSGIVFSVCSDVGRSRIQSLLEKSFGRLPARPDEPPSPTPAVLPEKRDIVIAREAKQAYVGRAFLLPAASPAGFARGYLLEVLLGVGPGSRLWDLRSTQNLAYNVGARATWTKGLGLFEAFLETGQEKRDKAVDALDAALGALYRSGLDAEELQATKNLAKAQILRSFEAKKTRAQMMGHWHVLGLGFEDVASVFERLEAVTLEEMNAFIKDVLGPDKSLLVVVGGGKGRP